jgi:hypothetical protein
MFARAKHEDDGSPLTDQEIADQLKDVVAAGHETTANTLGWRSSGCAGIPTSSGGWSPRPTMGARSSARRR